MWNKVKNNTQAFLKWIQALHSNPYLQDLSVCIEFQITAKPHHLDLRSESFKYIQIGVSFCADPEANSMDPI